MPSELDFTLLAIVFKLAGYAIVQTDSLPVTALLRAVAYLDRSFTRSRRRARRQKRRRNVWKPVLQ